MWRSQSDRAQRYTSRTADCPSGRLYVIRIKNESRVRESCFMNYSRRSDLNDDGVLRGALSRLVRPSVRRGRLLTARGPYRSCRASRLYMTVISVCYLSSCTGCKYTYTPSYSIARGRPIIVEWERDARHSAGLSLVRKLESQAAWALNSGRRRPHAPANWAAVKSETVCSMNRKSLCVGQAVQSQTRAKVIGRLTRSYA
ncbi:hypothetical protein EVAR_47341_1 [Eumeta japonica]|uniref:Uncharacterized protein n=1 Tax=Eumeta variegata TaxID=151549 RepID=A0A4C1WV15_EUMVA|nr:hypothetical protein EVAR_47341_1 [Eumeta japonica]